MLLLIETLVWEIKRIYAYVLCMIFVCLKMPKRGRPSETEGPQTRRRATAQRVAEEEPQPQPFALAFASLAQVEDRLTANITGVMSEHIRQAVLAEIAKLVATPNTEGDIQAANRQCPAHRTPGAGRH